MSEVKAYVMMRVLDTTHAALKRLSEATGEPMTELLERAVREMEAKAVENRQAERRGL